MEITKTTLAQLVEEQRKPFTRRWKCGTRKSIGLEARFSQKYVVEESGCWRWIGLSGGRYGNLMISHRSFYAHILSYHLFRGDVPEGMKVCHRCDNGMCVNPSHLFLGTQKDNMQDAAKKLRTTIGERNTQAKLTDSSVLTIRRLVSEGNSPSDVAAMFGVKRTTIYRVNQRRGWRHVL